MIKLFRHLSYCLQTKMLDPANYKIIVQCKSLDAQTRLEQAIAREFDELRQNHLYGASPARGNAGTCAGIEFELTT